MAYVSCYKVAFYTPYKYISTRQWTDGNKETEVFDRSHEQWQENKILLETILKNTNNFFLSAVHREIKITYANSNWAKNGSNRTPEIKYHDAGVSGVDEKYRRRLFMRHNRERNENGNVEDAVLLAWQSAQDINWRYTL